jgi:photosystem II stability/assembly factor-like uncharacterized protein
MVDQTNGWALTNQMILHTNDGGHTWLDMTPHLAPMNEFAAGTFVDKWIAWIAIPQVNANLVTVVRTKDGGFHWQISTIQVPSPTALDMPHFVGNLGWMEIITNGGPGAGSESADIWHTTDGGATWQRIASTDLTASGLTREGFKSGISFSSTSTGWATTSSDTGRPQNPGLYVTHDGGTTWQNQPLGDPPGQAAPQQIGTTPPVFFGSTGLMPVHITLPSIEQELVIYTTGDGGQTWTPTTPAQVDFNNVYVIDPQNIWASDTQTGDFFVTSDGGQSWQHIKNSFGIVKAFTLLDASNGWAITSSGLIQESNGTWHKVNYTIQQSN